MIGAAGVAGAVTLEGTVAVALVGGTDGVGATVLVGVGATVLVGIKTTVGTASGVAGVLQARASNRTAKMPGQIFAAGRNFNYNHNRSLGPS
jgi:hypothetical protein